MENGQKLRLAIWLVFMVAKRDMTHKQKTVILEQAYQLLLEYAQSMHDYTMDDIPF